MAKKKYYVVWKGVKPGIYHDWPSCEAAVFGFNGARYQSFPSLDEAQAAFERPPWLNQKAGLGAKKTMGIENKIFQSKPILTSLSVDAACSGNPGLMEYQGVDTASGQRIFYQGPFEEGTNNVGEFLALVHGLAHLKKQGLHDYPIYTDSQTALAWVRNKRAKTLLEANRKNKILFELIERAENWLKTHEFKNPLLKWDTKNWGEIPADFGRK